jgi:hypothetical protein
MTTINSNWFGGRKLSQPEFRKLHSFLTRKGFEFEIAYNQKGQIWGLIQVSTEDAEDAPEVTEEIRREAKKAIRG